MPRICEFRGIVIGMFFDDHPRPHFHVRYAEYRAVVAIDGAEVLRGVLPPAVLRLVRQWASEREQELMANWERAESSLPLFKIAPLT